MPTDTELMDWMEENQDKMGLEGDGAISYSPSGSWKDDFVIQMRDHKLRSSLSRAYYRFPLIAKEKADG